jgi:MFS superfamily sulfate permease-like transporter
MMSNVVISLFGSIGLTAWIYSQMHRRTGGNTQSAAAVAGIAGVLSFLVMMVLFATIFRS